MQVHVGIIFISICKFRDRCIMLNEFRMLNFLFSFIVSKYKTTKKVTLIIGRGKKTKFLIKLYRIQRKLTKRLKFPRNFYVCLIYYYLFSYSRRCSRIFYIPRGGRRDRFPRRPEPHAIRTVHANPEQWTRSNVGSGYCYWTRSVR